ncbi:MAG: MFS transporter [Jatrophihabitans sp.]|uniref:MFS transporter n=1 Tax=Jatrophihabitans sp. TaxID=1932789 RepID=UPI003F804455
MTTTERATGRRGLAFTAMIFAVAMTFIDQTIVSVAAPGIQADLGLTSSGLQWGINAYLVAMAATFAFGGRLADTLGARRMVTIGVAVFAGASALCGLTPSGRVAEAWLITFRALQGVGGALLYPAALAVVVGASDAARRGRTLAMFFGIAGALTAVGPSVGGYLTAWSWRSIFWINVPVAVIALVLVARAGIQDHRRQARLDARGLLFLAPGLAVVVIGLQQSTTWGWGNPLTLGALAAGAVLLVAFAAVERRAAEPLIELRAFRQRAFAVDNAVLFGAMIVFVPLFLLASEYGQIALGRTAAQASLLLLYFFAGFVVAAQVGGRMLDRGGARRPVVAGAVLAAVGLHQWAAHTTTLAVGPQVAFIVLAGAGLGLLLGQANTDALNHTDPAAYGQATGVTQTVRNFGSSVGLAATSALLLGHLRTNLTSSLAARGVPSGTAHRVAAGIARLDGHRAAGAIPGFVRGDFAAATGSVLDALAVVMVATAVVAAVGLPRHHRDRTVTTAAPTDTPQLVTLGGH